MAIFERILIGSRNPAKIERYGGILSLHAQKVLGLRDLGIEDKPSEAGETAEENAEIKGAYYATRTGLVTFSEDEALYADFLPESQQPGVHVRRINGLDEVDDDQLLAHWENIVVKVPERERIGRWHIAYCITSPDGYSYITSLDHPIVFFSPSSNTRIPGWPMSSLTGLPAFRKPLSEMTDEENRVSNAITNNVIRDTLEDLLGQKLGL